MLRTRLRVHSVHYGGHIVTLDWPRELIASWPLAYRTPGSPGANGSTIFKPLGARKKVCSPNSRASRAITGSRSGMISASNWLSVRSPHPCGTQSHEILRSTGFLCLGCYGPPLQRGRIPTWFGLFVRPQIETDGTQSSGSRRCDNMRAASSNFSVARPNACSKNRFESFSALGPPTAISHIAFRAEGPAS